jgi:hypothetical protein
VDAQRCFISAGKELHRSLQLFRMFPHMLMSR